MNDIDANETQELSESMQMLLDDIYNNKLTLNSSVGITFRKRHYKLIRDE